MVADWLYGWYSISNNVKLSNAVTINAGLPPSAKSNLCQIPPAYDLLLSAYLGFNDWLVNENNTQLNTLSGNSS